MTSEKSGSGSGSGSSAVTPTSHTHTMLLLQIPNWGDDPSSWGLNLMNLALDKYNQDWAQLVKDKPDTFALVQFAFVGGLHISSFVDDGVWCHLNFKTKKADPVDSVFEEEHGPYLFFAELKRRDLSHKYIVKSVCNFGPAKYVQRAELGGCLACDRVRHRVCVMHPMQGFNVGHAPHYQGIDIIPAGQGQGQHQDKDDLMRETEAILALQNDIVGYDATVLHGELPDRLAKLSLKYYNEAAWNNQEAEYKFMRNKCCCTFEFNVAGIRWYHINYVANKESKGDEFLFFAEVKSVYSKPQVEVVHSEILGPASHVAPRLDGCIACDMTSCGMEMVHPINGGKSRGKFLAN